MAKTISGIVGSPVSHITATGKISEAVIDPKETYRVIKNKTMNTVKHISIAQGNKTTRIPAKVAIPLPPLKPAKTGKYFLCGGAGKIPGSRDHLAGPQACHRNGEEHTFQFFVL